MVRLKTNYEIVRSLQDLEHFRMVANEALGGGNSNGTPSSPASVPPSKDVPQNLNDFMTAWKSLGSGVAVAGAE